MTISRRAAFAVAVGLVLGCLTVTSLIRTQPAFAQKQPTGQINVWLPQSERSTFMMTIVGQDGSIKGQKEATSQTSGSTLVAFRDIPVGIYDVRFEGDGFTTLVKRGIAVVASTDNDLNPQMVKGQGVHVVEYSSAVSGSDFLARLTRLEKALAELTKK